MKSSALRAWFPFNDFRRKLERTRSLLAKARRFLDSDDNQPEIAHPSTSPRVLKKARGLQVESLEPRLLMNAVVIAGTANADTIAVSQVDDHTIQSIINGGTPTSYPLTTGDTVTISGLAGNDTISLTGLTIDNVSFSVQGGDNDDTINIGQGTTIGMTISGGAGTDTVKGADDTENVWRLEGVDSGSLNDNTITKIGFTGIEKLLGGADVDRFVFAGAIEHDAITTTFQLDGGTGSNTLDFYEFENGVIVNLTTMALNRIVIASPLLTSPLVTSAANIANVIGSWGNDLLTGNAQDNVLSGGPGNDTYFFDTDSQLGNDSIGEKADEGIDTLDFSASSNNLTVNLSTAEQQIVNSNLKLTFGLAGDFLENVIGGSGNDALTGNAAANVLTGGTGNDTLSGGAGDDTYVFDADLLLGSDSILAGSGADTIDLSATSANVALNLGLTTAQTIVANTTNLTLTLASGHAVRNIIGGSGNDALTGDANANILTGGAGNDTLVGGAGDDTYRFDVDSALGSDSITEAASGGNDTLDFSASSAAVTATLASNTAVSMSGVLTLTLSSFADIENLIGGAGADTLTGNSAANLIEGGAGNDILSGGSGNDTYRYRDGAQGDDTILEDSAGGSADTLDFSLLTSGVTVDLSQTAQQLVVGTSQTPLLRLTFTNGANLENVIAGSGDDTLTGNSAVNVLTGGLGTDTLIATRDANITLTNASVNMGTEADTISGFERAILTGGSGNNQLNAGAFTGLNEGTSLSLLNGGQGIRKTDVRDDFDITLSDGTTVVPVRLLDARTIGDVLNAINAANSHLSATLNSTKTAIHITDNLGGTHNLKIESPLDSTAAADLGILRTGTLGVLDGASIAPGSVVLNGMGGGDTLTGSVGNDILVGGAGNDSLDGGLGDDVFAFAADSWDPLESTCRHASLSIL